mmetsp:Transcript_16556/g.66828  ORF Transcript_16556/g.66828 Transcript_16556/m.66828 type:complete len:260 (-) Transcript_16556:2-781(-)
MFLMKPMTTGTPRSSANAAIDSSSATDGAPGFSRMTCVAPASIAPRNSAGLSTVRPATSARRFSCCSCVDEARLPRNASATSAANETAFSADHGSTTFSANVRPASESRPPPRNHGSTTSVRRADGHAPEKTCCAWNHPMPRPGSPAPMTATSTTSACGAADITTPARRDPSAADGAPTRSAADGMHHPRRNSSGVTKPIVGVRWFVRLRDWRTAVVSWSSSSRRSGLATNLDTACQNDPNKPSDSALEARNRTNQQTP